MQQDLFGEQLTKPVKYKVKGYADRPGTGPEGETCRTCEHIERVSYHDRVYLKCGLVEWTHGPGTDIRAKSPACSKWEKKSDQ